MNIWQRSLIVFCVPTVGLLAAALHQPQSPQPAHHHFTKIDGSGEPLPNWAGPWPCVCDQRSGLLWEVKTDSENIHDGLWTYSWYRESSGSSGKESAVGAPNQGDCYFEDERCDTADLIRRARQEQLCGQQDWRLPTADEMRTLVDTEAKAGQPTIDTAFFPKTKRGDYWTSQQEVPLQDVYKTLDGGAVAISFVDGQQITIPHRNAAFVRLVSESSKSCH
ncbi:DUF1566 domain-containing protein [Microbulbifer sp. ALW1]|uniref:Lcl C-terminal domain-containing protein n=1 Tax=Microbulbifer sp. (strain ALW1) TaxID=1516059 RepID=UPI001F1CA147|nr:DUF1566 domain-containing protein [Microbulbifer sp. ALW1]